MSRGKPAMLSGTKHYQQAACKNDIPGHPRVWRTSVHSAKYVSLSNSPRRRSTMALTHSLVCSWWTQLWWLLKRSLVAQLRNPTDVTSRLLLSCWIGLLAGIYPCPFVYLSPPLWAVTYAHKQHRWCTSSKLQSQAASPLFQGEAECFQDAARNCHACAVNMCL